MQHDHLAQEEIIDRLATYVAQVALVATGDPDQCARDGIVVGLSIAIALAAGATGPLTGEELARVGADVAALAYARLAVPEEEQQ